jgi:hypothetical protein
MPRGHWVKIDRALDHIDALDKSIQAWISKYDPYSVREEHGPYLHIEPDGPPHTLMSGMTRTALVLHVSEPFPVEWSALIGDAVHNLRSALDNLAFALNAKGYADATNGRVLTDEDAATSEFPIIGNVNRKGNVADGNVIFANARRKIAHVDPAARAIIEGIQPCKRREEWATDPLWLIHDLDRIDKHRELVISTAAMDRLDGRHFKIDGPVFSYDLTLGVGKTLDDGGELASWVTIDDSVTGPGPYAKVEYDFNFTFRETFGKGTPCAGWPVVKTLRDLRDYVRVKVASRLDRFL